jgi:hypothetical protein
MARSEAILRAKFLPCGETRAGPQPSDQSARGPVRAPSPTRCIIVDWVPITKVGTCMCCLPLLRRELVLVKPHRGSVIK